MICRSYYTTLQDACVLFDRVLTPFIFLFFFFSSLEAFLIRREGTICVTAMIKEHVYNFSLTCRTRRSLFYSYYFQRDTQGPASDRSARRRHFPWIIVTRYNYTRMIPFTTCVDRIVVGKVYRNNFIN